MRRAPLAPISLLLLAACGGASDPGTPPPRPARAGRLLIADAVTDTYRLINGVLGGDAVETPDCRHPAFGPHITQAADATLGKPVFVFHAHVTPDDDRCMAGDRQRVEIKTYDRSPDYLKAFPGDTTTYRWRFRLDAGFRPSASFTHVHQLKPVEGDDDLPIVTLTARAGTPERMQLLHVSSAGVTTTLAAVELAPFKGAWVEAHERVTWGPRGAYAVEVRRLADGAVLLAYAAPDLDLWRTGTAFVRPKWGIYRSLANAGALRDEQVRFDRFCLAKGADVCPPE
jgi:hypothetical protein